ncbi:hypothetical protein [Streptomyces canus]|uniref:hypothetical protein n=1 Tax=Streptomyces canus TaxID=58343 RepID=UPI0030E1CCFA
MALGRHACQGGDGRLRGHSARRAADGRAASAGQADGGLGEGPDRALADRPEQRARDAALGDAEPVVGTGWAYGYDPENALT